MSRPGASLSQKGLFFKIVYQTVEGNANGASATGVAALYCNNRLMTQLNGLPSRGGFAIRTGGEKSLSKLSLRSIAKDERLAKGEISLDRKKDISPSDDLLEDLNEGEAKPKFVATGLKRFVEEDWVWGGGLPDAHVGFRKWLRERGVSVEEVGAESWDKVRLMTIQSLADTPSRRRQYYWSRRYANYLTPRTFALAAEGIRAAVPEKDVKGFVALSGHALYLGKTAMPLDMFELAKYPELTPGVSDWMTSGSWRWDSHQAVAYSVAPFNAGARRYGEPPVNFPMMHCVYPSVFRSYTQLANQCKLISYWTFGPSYAATEGFWSDNFWSYHAVHKLNNRAAQLDDVLGEAVMRPSRVAMLYSHSTHLWSSADSYNDKRAAFLGLSHEYFQPELVTEEQVVDDCLRHYDALYVLEPHVARAAQSKITKWTRGGGLLWTCSNSLVRDEYDEPCDWLANEVGIRRIGESKVLSSTMNAAKDQPPFRPHSVVFGRRFKEVAFEDGVTRATYDDGSPAWIEKPFGRGRVVYLGHRAGVTYSGQRISIGGRPVIWGDAGRDTLVRPLKELGVSRELTLSEPTVMASALSAKNGTVVVLYNMRPKPIEPLEITLKEDSAPKLVRVFEGDRLVDLPFDFANGKLTITLPRLNVNEGQMIVLRGNSAPADSRPSVMEARAVKLLASDDPMDLSAGAWFAGFHPEWNLQESILPLVGHSRWEVRRSAVEAVGRLRYVPAAPKLADMVEDDPDDHVRADALHALALIDPAVFVPIAMRCAVDANLIVRLETMRAVDSLLSRKDRGEGKDSEAPVDDGLSNIVATCLKDDAPAVRHLAIELYGRLQVKSLLAHALRTIPGSDDLERWAKAVATDAVAFSQYLERGMPGGENFFFALARVRQDPALVKELKRRFASGERSEKLMNAV
ncbi:MAG: HEAT repeat domain-containing protein, partial [Opitutales bacterium]